MFQPNRTIEPLNLARHIVQGVRAEMAIGSSNITPEGNARSSANRAVSLVDAILVDLRGGQHYWAKQESTPTFKLRDGGLPGLSYTPNMTWGDSSLSLKRISDAIKASVYRAGNCGEMTSLALSMLCEIERRGLFKDIQFSFDVINSEQHMLLKITLNNVVVICDPWVNHVCSSDPGDLEELVEKLDIAGITDMTTRVLLQHQTSPFALNSHEKVEKWMAVYEVARGLVLGAVYGKPFDYKASDLKDMTPDAVEHLCKQAVLQKNYLFLIELKKKLQGMTDVDPSLAQKLVDKVDEFIKKIEIIPKELTAVEQEVQLNAEPVREGVIVADNGRIDLAVFYVLANTQQHDLARLVINQENADIFVKELNHLLVQIDSLFAEIKQHGATKEKQERLEAYTILAVNMLCGLKQNTNISDAQVYGAPVLQLIGNALEEFNRGDNKASLFEIISRKASQLSDPRHINQMMYILVDMDVAKKFDKNKVDETRTMIALRVGDEHVLKKLIMDNKFDVNTEMLGVVPQNQECYQVSLAKILSMMNAASQHGNHDEFLNLFGAAITVLEIVDVTRLGHVMCLEPYMNLLNTLVAFNGVIKKTQEQGVALIEGIIAHSETSEIKASILELAIKNGMIDLQEQNEDGNTPLQVVLDMHDVESAMLLLNHMKSEDLQHESPGTLEQAKNLAKESNNEDAVMKVSVAMRNAGEHNVEVGPSGPNMPK